MLLYLWLTCGQAILLTITTIVLHLQVTMMLGGLIFICFSFIVYLRALFI